MPSGWSALALSIRQRDEHTCRRCGKPESAEVNHILPRRIAPDLIADAVNLATLCERCHGIVTMMVEPQLYMGDVSHFDRFLNVLRTTGPVPTREQIAAAYKEVHKYLVTH
jgi:hypothetical protein